MPVIVVKSSAKAREKPCLRCGYSLRKLQDIRHCPECGLAVWLSLNQNDALDWSRPAWLTQIAFASAALAFAQLLATLAWTSYQLAPASRAAPRADLAALLLGAYLLVYNVALLALAASERRYPDKLLTHRIWLRAVAFTAIAFAALLEYRAFQHQRLGRPPFIESLESFVDELAAVAIVLASTLATFAYLRRLAQRIPNAFVARTCGYFFVLPAIPPIAYYFMYGLFFHILQWAPWVYLPASTALFAYFAYAFLRASHQAKTNWASESAPAS